MLKRFIQCLIAVFCGSAAHAFQPMNVLFIGNSYTHMNDMPDLFGRLAESKGVKINVVMSAKSNHTFRMHCERPELFETIKSRKWDYVIVQGFSRELSFDPASIDTASIPYFQRIADSIYANNPCTNILLYMTWGYRNGYPIREETNTYEKMQDKIVAGYKYLSELYNLPIVPVGNVYREIRKNYPEINLYRDDDQHPTLAGSYAIACSFYTAIFKSSPENSFYSSLDEKTAKVIQKTAFNYVYNHLEEFKLRLNTFEVKYERTKDNRFVVYCKSNYPGASSIRWDFGDGSSSTKANDTHYFRREGEYTLKMTVHDSCGTRIIYRRLTFHMPNKPVKAKPSAPVKSNQTTKKI